MFLLSISLVNALSAAPPLSISLFDKPKIDTLLLGEGKDTSLLFSVTIPKGSHIYSLEESMGTSITLKYPLETKVSNIGESRTQTIYDPVLEKEVDVHIGHAEFELKAPFVEEAGEILGMFNYRICNNSICSLPQAMPFSVRP